MNAELNKNQRTLVLIKTDAVRNKHVGAIISRIEWPDRYIVAMKMIRATKDQCMAHYNKDDAWCAEQGQRKIDQGLVDVDRSAVDVGRQILEQMAEYFMDGRIIVLVVEGPNVIEDIDHIVGATQPISASPGTLRYEFSTDSYAKANGENRALHNVAHCSDSPEEAAREIEIWFPEGIEA